MNVAEGSRRMVRAGRRMLAAASCAFVLLILPFESWVYLRDSIRMERLSQFTIPILAGAIPMAALAIVAGAALWLGGWILEGFAKKNPF